VLARVDDELSCGAELPFVAVQGVLVELGGREVAIPGDAAVETKLAELTAKTGVQRLRKRQNGVETSVERGRRLL
jgi:hypothetical protein